MYCFIACFCSSRLPAAASPAGTGEPPGGPDPAAPHDRRSRLERTPRSRRASPPGHPDRGGDRASVLFHWAARAKRYSAAVSNRPDRGRDRASALFHWVARTKRYSAAVSNRPDHGGNRVRSGDRALALFCRAARAPSGTSPLRFQPRRSRRRSWVSTLLRALLLRRVLNRPDRS
ncbi:hypothetical protein VNO78_19670 [Psophocarpus tetragonolobus]|uniref:Uncharacterized protein n=1 Tax=Psophocarpus tetragonolobus TaxID=3891 RepID=A0AAN9SCB6_PSOTE